MCRKTSSGSIWTKVLIQHLNACKCRFHQISSHDGGRLQRMVSHNILVSQQSTYSDICVEFPDMFREGDMTLANKKDPSSYPWHSVVDDFMDSLGDLLVPTVAKHMLTQVLFPSAGPSGCCC